ncbi:hypothetical protein U1Q18_035800 [Sarracenia purpurea var. burkii]
MAIGKLKSQLGFWVLELPSTNGLLIAGSMLWFRNCCLLLGFVCFGVGLLGFLDRSLFAIDGIVDVAGLSYVVSSVLNWSDFIRSFIGVWFKWNCCHMNLLSLDGFLSMEFAVMEPGFHGVLL